MSKFTELANLYAEIMGELERFTKIPTLQDIERSKELLEELDDISIHLKKAIEAAEVEKKLEVSPDLYLAKLLHSTMCIHNHTDGCGWYYEGSEEKPDWTGWAHAEYLKKARRLIAEAGSPQDAVKFVEISQKLKNV